MIELLRFKVILPINTSAVVVNAQIRDRGKGISVPYGLTGVFEDTTGQDQLLSHEVPNLRIDTGAKLPTLWLIRIRAKSDDIVKGKPVAELKSRMDHECESRSART